MAGPVQPGPPVPGAQQAMAQRPFSLQRQPGIPAPWRERLDTWANHPDAGPHLKLLAALAKIDQGSSNGAGPREPGS